MENFVIPPVKMEEIETEPIPFLYDREEAERLKEKTLRIKDQTRRIAELEEALSLLLQGVTE